DAFAAIRAKLSLVSDGRHALAYVAPKANVGGKGDGAYLFYSADGQSYDQVEIDDVIDDESDTWTISYIDPRFPIPAGEVKLDKGEIHVSCRGRQGVWSPIDASRLAGARLSQQKNYWNAVALGHDTVGTFYYVDVGYGGDNRDHVRLFIGPKG